MIHPSPEYVVDRLADRIELLNRCHEAETCPAQKHKIAMAIAFDEMILRTIDRLMTSLPLAVSIPITGVIVDGGIVWKK